MDNTTKYLIAAGAFLGLALVKSYFSGSTCRLRRELRGQVAIVTGGNTGIGRQTALALAKQGCTVIIAARDHLKGYEAVAYVRNHSHNDNVEFHELDLSSKMSIEKFAEVIKGKFEKVNILVNNAGVMGLPERRLTEDGFEFQMGINHLGHFYLTYMLWDLIKKTDNVRIINVSSGLHKKNQIEKHKQLTIDFNTLDGTYHSQGHKLNLQYHPIYAYAASKMANVLFTQQLAARIALVNPDARVLSLHPGVVRTELSRYMLTGWKTVLLFFVYPLVWILTKSPVQGAQTTIYTIMEDKDRLRNGAYYSECGLGQKGVFADDPANQKRLWERSEELLKITFNVY